MDPSNRPLVRAIKLQLTFNGRKKHSIEYILKS